MAFIRAAQGSSGPSPTSITPSNSNPPALTANTPVNPTASGYAISGYSDATPSNSNPAILRNEQMRRMTANGYAISSYQNVSPAPDGQSFNAGMVNMSTGGFAYSARPSGGPTIANLAVSGKTLYRNVNLGSNKTSEFYTSSDLLVAGSMHGYGGKYAKIDIDGTTFLYSRESGNNAFWITTYGIFIPKNHTIKVTTEASCACNLNFYYYS